MRIVAGKSDLRTAVMALAGGAPAPLTLARAERGIAQGSDVALEADRRVNSDTCGKDNDCCSGSCSTDGFCD